MTSRIAPWTVPLLRGPFSVRQVAALTLVFAALLGSACSRQATVQKPAPLSQGEVIDLLHGSVPSMRIAHLVAQRGIDFEITSDFKKKLHDAGATQELIEALVKAGGGSIPDAEVKTGESSKGEAKPQSGNLKVKTNPGEAQVYLSDEFKGLTSPQGELRVPSISPGDYRLRVSKVGYQTWEDQVTVSSVETETVFVTLNQTSSESLTETSNLSGSYAGEVTNTTVGVSAPFAIAIREENDGIYGCITVQRPLVGSGGFQGTVNGSKVVFEATGKTLRIRFIGELQGDALKGSYTVLSTQEHGEFQLRRENSKAPPVGFDPAQCRKD